MIEREIRTIEGGGLYSDQVTVFYEDSEQPGRRIIFHCDPDGLYALIHRAVVAMSTLGASGNNPEEKEKTALAKLLKVAVKGILLMYGSRILDAVFGTKDHPKPGKGDDLLDWYQDIFTRLGISYLMTNDTVLTGRVVNGSVEQAVIGVGSITSRPVTQTSEEGGAGTSGSTESDGDQGDGGEYGQAGE